MTTLGGVLLFFSPLPRGVRARVRLRHPGAARVATWIADRVGVGLASAGLGLLAVAVFLPGPGTAVRGLIGGAAIGVLTGLPFAGEGRRRRVRLAARRLPPDPLRSGSGPVGEDDPARLATRVGPREARRALAAARRSGAVGTDAVWRTGLVLARRGEFRDGLDLLRRAAEGGDRDAGLALCEGLVVAGREAQAVHTLDDMERPLASDPRGVPRA